MKKLIICEKPTLAQNVSKALKIDGEQVLFKKEEGYSVSDNYIIVPAFGHLFTLCDPEEYREGYSVTEKYPWKLEDLPFFPSPYQFTLKKDFKTKKTDAGIKKQYEIIKKLIHSKEVDSIIHCGDSDREGELIIRLILEEAKNMKTVERLWIPDQVESTILQGLKTMKNDNTLEYDCLFEEAKSRMFVDWLYGINLSRYATLKTGSLQRMGRVKTAIIKSIYDRDTAIATFTPKDYYSIESVAETKGVIIELKSKKQFDRDEKNKAEAYSEALNSLNPGTVTDLQTKRKFIRSPKLFSQSGLQNVLSKRFKYAPDKTLSLVQSLYEKGFVTYPRTATEYMATAEKEKAKKIIDKINETALNVLSMKDSKSIFDDSKIESHSAITPTEKLPSETSFKNEEEKNCYQTIYDRFCAVFCSEECEVDETVMTINVNEEEIFELKGQVSITRGWKAIEPVKEEVNNLPHLSIGDSVEILFKALSKKTSPPKHYTVETLNNFLKNPFKDEKKSIDKDDTEYYKALLEGSEIGTEATRPGIIKECIETGYISLLKENYTITPIGIYYIESAQQLGINLSKEKTVEINKTLKKVYRGELKVADAVKIAESEIQAIISQNNVVDKHVQTRDSIGICPVCKKAVFEGKSTFSCESNKFSNSSGKWELIEGCGFSISKNIASKNITVPVVKKLLDKGRSDLVKGFKSKAGKSFDTYLVLTKDNKINFEFKK